MPNVLNPRDLVSRPDNIDETVLHTIEPASVSQSVSLFTLSCDHSTAFILIGSSSFLQVMMTIIRSRMSLKFGKIRLGTVELAALERLEKSRLTYNVRNGAFIL